MPCSDSCTLHKPIKRAGASSPPRTANVLELHSPAPNGILGLFTNVRLIPYLAAKEQHAMPLEWPSSHTAGCLSVATSDNAQQQVWFESRTSGLGTAPGLMKQWLYASAMASTKSSCVR